MSVANGRPLLATPGPTNIPDRVLQAMMRPAEELHTQAIVDLTFTLLSDLQRLFRTSGQAYLYACNGHGAWEAALTNVLSRGDKVLVLASGRFARGWGEMAAFMGADVEVMQGSWRAAVDPADVEERLRCDTAHEIKAVLMVQIDTASGVVNDVAAVRRHGGRAVAQHARAGGGQWPRCPAIYVECEQAPRTRAWPVGIKDGSRTQPVDLGRARLPTAPCISLRTIRQRDDHDFARATAVPDPDKSQPGAVGRPCRRHFGRNCLGKSLWACFAERSTAQVDVGRLVGAQPARVSQLPTVR